MTSPTLHPTVKENSSFFITVAFTSDFHYLVNRCKNIRLDGDVTGFYNHSQEKYMANTRRRNIRKLWITYYRNFIFKIELLLFLISYCLCVEFSMCYWFKLRIYRLKQIFSLKLKNLKEIFNQACCLCLIILEIGGPLVSGYANRICRKQSLISAPNHSATGTKHLLDML